jgi:hypothetical protein
MKNLRPLSNLIGMVFGLIATLLAACPQFSGEGLTTQYSVSTTCVDISNCRYSSIRGARGGAILCTSDSTTASTIIATLFVSCAACRSGSYAGSGGGVYWRGSQLLVSRCCGVATWADTFGHFLAGLTASSLIPMDECSMVSTGSSESYDQVDGGIALDPNVGISIRVLNATSCRYGERGSVTYSESGAPVYKLSYVNVVKCSGVYSICRYTSFTNGSFSDCNFYNNTLSSDWYGVITAFDSAKQIRLERCFFSGPVCTNMAGNVLYYYFYQASTNSFLVADCVFPTSAVGASLVKDGSGYVVTSATAMHAIHGLVTWGCSGVFSRSASAPQSTRPLTASPVPTVSATIAMSPSPSITHSPPASTPPQSQSPSFSFTPPVNRISEARQNYVATGMFLFFLGIFAD